MNPDEFMALQAQAHHHGMKWLLVKLDEMRTERDDALLREQVLRRRLEQLETAPSNGHPATTEEEAA